MDSTFALCTLLFSVLLVLKNGQISVAREISKGQNWNDMDKVVVHDKHAMDDHLQSYTEKEERNDQRVLAKHVHVHVHGHPSPNHIDLMDPSLKVFFKVNDLKIGNRFPIYFPSKDPSKSPPLLSREESDSIPFSSEKFDYLLDFFSISKDSPQAKAMETTLGHCEAEPIIGETKFCATSLESLLDSTRGIFGLDVQFRVLATTHLTEFTTILQNYTVLEDPRVNLTPKIVGCHMMPYPYAVYYCHCQENDNQLFEVSLGGDGGERVKAVGLCHMDTSHWDPDHVSFRVLGTRPGESPVCHFFPADNLVWVPAISA